MFNEIFHGKKKKILILISIFLITTLILSMLETISAKDITIDTKTPGGLKKTVESIKDGDTIYLKNGVYKGKNNTNITINKNITIKGLGSSVVLDGQGKSQFFIIQRLGSKVVDGQNGPSLEIDLNNKVSLNNIKFVNGRNSVELFSSGVIESSGTLIISGCTFTNNKAVGFAGAIFSWGNCTLINCTFINNRANQNGGAIQSVGKLTVSKCTFKDNKVNGDGGAIHSDNLTISSCTFTNNKADNGGAIYSNDILTMNKCTFKNNDGGAIYAIEKATVKNCIFKNNKASHGGAISTDGTLSLKSSTFQGNTAKYYGGAIYTNNKLEYYPSYSGRLTIDKCTFNNNKVGMKGGAIFNVDFKTMKITNSKFTKNIASKKYNAIYNNKAKLTKKNVKITPKDGTKIKK